MQTNAKLNENVKDLNEPNKNLKKSSEVPKEKIIRLYHDTLFEFDCNVEDGHLNITLTELDSATPSIYTKSITLEELYEIHISFKSCVDLEAAEEHINYIFKKQGIKIYQNESGEITLDLKIYNISQENIIRMVLKKK